jgi:hypothetical protein
LLISISNKYWFDVLIDRLNNYFIVFIGEKGLVRRFSLFLHSFYLYFCIIQFFKTYYIMKTQSDLCRRKCKRGCSGFGFLLIIIGVLLLFTRLQVIPTPYVDVILSWPMLLLFFGVLSLFRLRIVNAILFLSVGTFFMIPEIAKIPNNFIGTIPANFTALYWPVLLIIAGVLIVVIRLLFPKSHVFFGPRFHRHHFHRHGHQFNREFSRKHGHEFYGEFSRKRDFCYNGNGRVNQSTVFFRSGENIVLDPEFTGGEITCVFGESTLDLRKTNLKEGQTRLEIEVVFGSAIIYVPKNWNVQLNVESVFGGFVDKRSILSDEENNDTTKTLIIVGSCVFGGGELKN